MIVNDTLFCKLSKEMRIMECIFLKNYFFYLIMELALNNFLFTKRILLKK